MIGFGLSKSNAKTTGEPIWVVNRDVCYESDNDYYQRDPSKEEVLNLDINQQIRLEAKENFILVNVIKKEIHARSFPGDGKYSWHKPDSDFSQIKYEPGSADKKWLDMEIRRAQNFKNKFSSALFKLTTKKVQDQITWQEKKEAGPFTNVSIKFK